VVSKENSKGFGGKAYEMHMNNYRIKFKMFMYKMSDKKGGKCVENTKQARQIIIHI
jgi:hypothetical protein